MGPGANRSQGDTPMLEELPRRLALGFAPRRGDLQSDTPCPTYSSRALPSRLDAKPGIAEHNGSCRPVNGPLSGVCRSKRSAPVHLKSGSKHARATAAHHNPLPSPVPSPPNLQSPTRTPNPLPKEYQRLASSRLHPPRRKKKLHAAQSTSWARLRRRHPPRHHHRRLR